MEKSGIEPTAFYSLRDLSRALNIGTDTLRRWISSGRLPAKKTGKKWWVAGEAIINLLKPGT